MKFHRLFPSLFAATALAVFSSTAFPNESESLTLLPVEIDPLGADPDTPWTINIGSLNVRDNPTTADSRRLGSLKRGDEVSGIYLIVKESDEEWLQIDFNGQPGFISRIGFSRVHPRNLELMEEHGNLPFGEEIVNRWWGIPLDYEADDLVEIPEEYRRRSETRDYRLRREAMETLAEMIDAMRADGLELFVSSPYRSGSLQTSMFHRRMRNNLAQRGTAPPGHSEHQLGTTADLAPALTGRTLRNSDPQHAWLKKNGAKYGWRQTYLAENIEETGYIEEPWHWRYIGRENLAADNDTTEND